MFFQYRSDGKSDIFICVMIINVDVSSSLNMNIKQSMRSKLLTLKQVNTINKQQHIKLKTLHNKTTTTNELILNTQKN